MDECLEGMQLLNYIFLGFVAFHYLTLNACEQHPPSHSFISSNEADQFLDDHGHMEYSRAAASGEVWE